MCACACVRVCCECDVPPLLLLPYVPPPVFQVFSIAVMSFLLGSARLPVVCPMRACLDILRANEKWRLADTGQAASRIRRQDAKARNALEHGGLEFVERFLHLLAASVWRERKRQDLHRSDELAVEFRHGGRRADVARFGQRANLVPATWIANELPKLEDVVVPRELHGWPILLVGYLRVAGKVIEGEPLLDSLCRQGIPSEERGGGAQRRSTTGEHRATRRFRASTDARRHRLQRRSARREEEDSAHLPGEHSWNVWRTTRVSYSTQKMVGAKKPRAARGGVC